MPLIANIVGRPTTSIEHRVDARWFMPTTLQLFIHGVAEELVSRLMFRPLCVGPGR